MVVGCPAASVREPIRQSDQDVALTGEHDALELQMVRVSEVTSPDPRRSSPGGDRVATGAREYAHHHGRQAAGSHQRVLRRRRSTRATAWFDAE